MIAAGPLSSIRSRVDAALSAGVGAVVTKTIYTGRSPSQPEMVVRVDHGLLNTSSYSDRPIEHWLEDIRVWAHHGDPIVVSIYAPSPSKIAALAQRVENAGAQAIELGISCPTVEGKSGMNASQVSEWVRAVRRAVGVPIAVKLAALIDAPLVARAAVEAGANAIAVSDALPALLVRDKNSPPIRAGLSGSIIRPIVLRSVYEIAALDLEADIIAIGGVSSADHVVEYLHSGACAVQVLSSLITEGLPLIEKIIHDLHVHFEQHT
jgi:dihydroorotate dehydrogenase